MTARRPRSGYEAFEDDSDDEPGPPALSTYAMSLLEKLDVSDTHPRNVGGNGQTQTASGRGRSYEVSVNGTGGKQEGGTEVSNLENSHYRDLGKNSLRSLSRTRQGLLHMKDSSGSRRHPRLKPRLSLGAPRRVSGSKISLEMESNMDNESIKRNKRPLTATRAPIHIRTGCSPVVKRSDRGDMSCSLELEKTPTRMSERRKSMDESELDLLATPEQARRAQVVPKSQEKVKQMQFNVWENNKENEPRSLAIDFSDRGSRNKKGEIGRNGMSRRNSRNSTRSDRSSVLAKELLRQKQRMLAEMSQKSVGERSNRAVREKMDVDPKSGSGSVGRSNILEVNGRQFSVIEQIGKGGSSRVYRAKYTGGKEEEPKGGFNRHDSYAVKVVRLAEHEQSTVDEFKGEVSILQRLHDEERVVKLLDYSTSKKNLMFVMEFGEIDLAHVLANRSGKPFDLEFVRYHTREIIKCVEAVHRAGVVHSDLKPANFVFVRGVLKLIDFGISNQVSDHTVNVYRECQMGTPNYMAPETLIEAGNVWKVGKPADIWSCGCIIYQMCYGKPPYAQYPGSKKIIAITNSQLQITYPRTSPHGGPPVNCLAIDTMRKCLRRDPDRRATAEEMLKMPFLSPKTVTERFMGDLVRNAVKYGAVHPDMSDKKIELLVRNVWRRVNEYC
ncbi:DEBR0S2_04500g1_1 [Brettanomyces bruxellensis]|uniref:DEBR0S2_04500g1_1 n=1 Tax=Dekkera bruxellensis TaxID=5007 RepID=A0A7D9CWJ8_DEKBR|nr:DEBR0S2_04500g1_1 [Brettanomyces bruxellensis]